MTTTKQDTEFAEHIACNALEEAISWIAQNIPPQEVFHHEDLEYWAKNNGFILEDE